VRPFWVDRHFSMLQIGAVPGTLGVVTTVLGALLGGNLTKRWGVIRALWLLGIAQAASNLTYAAVAALRPQRRSCTPRRSWSPSAAAWDRPLLGLPHEHLRQKPRRNAVCPPQRPLRPRRACRRHRVGLGCRTLRLHRLFQPDVLPRLAGSAAPSLGRRWTVERAAALHASAPTPERGVAFYRRRIHAGDGESPGLEQVLPPAEEPLEPRPGPGPLPANRFNPSWSDAVFRGRWRSAGSAGARSRAGREDFRSSVATWYSKRGTSGKRVDGLVFDRTAGGRLWNASRIPSWVQTPADVREDVERALGVWQRTPGMAFRPPTTRSRRSWKTAAISATTLATSRDSNPRRAPSWSVGGRAGEVVDVQIPEAVGLLRGGEEGPADPAAGPGKALGGAAHQDRSLGHPRAGGDAVCWLPSKRISRTPRRHTPGCPARQRVRMASAISWSCACEATTARGLDGKQR